MADNNSNNLNGGGDPPPILQPDGSTQQTSTKINQDGNIETTTVITYPDGSVETITSVLSAEGEILESTISLFNAKGEVQETTVTVFPSSGGSETTYISYGTEGLIEFSQTVMDSKGKTIETTSAFTDKTGRVTDLTTTAYFANGSTETTTLSVNPNGTIESITVVTNANGDILETTIAQTDQNQNVTGLDTSIFNSNGSVDTTVTTIGNNGETQTVVTTTDPQGNTTVVSVEGDSTSSGNASGEGSSFTNVASNSGNGPLETAGQSIQNTIDNVESQTTTQNETQTNNNATTNSPPSIVSDDEVTVLDNTDFVIDVNAEDPDPDQFEGHGLTYSILAGNNGMSTNGFDNHLGPDGYLFDIDPQTGELTFKTPPDYYAPLDQGQNNIYDVEVKVTDSGGLYDIQHIRITVLPINDAPVISLENGDSNTSVLSETDSPLVTSGTLTLFDRDQINVPPPNPLSNMVTPSVISVTPSGATTSVNVSNSLLFDMLTLSPSWITANPLMPNNLYWDFDSTSESFDSLGVGQSLTLTYTIQGNDGIDDSNLFNIIITINGTNDSALIAGLDFGEVTEDIIPTVQGTLFSSDVDNTDNIFETIALGSPSNMGYGTYGMTNNGTWTYNLNNSHPMVDALNVDDQLLDSVTVFSEDGTPHTVNITIHGTNDPAIISGDSAGTVIEDMTLTAQGTLFSSDVDNNDNIFQPISSGTPTTNGFGTFELAANGNWTFTLDNNHPLVDALNVGVQLTDSIIVHSEDGTPHTVNITIQGKNDAAIITGTTSGTALEDSGVIAQGTLFSSDVDNNDNVFQPISSGTPTTNGFGTYELAASGVWKFTLNDNHPLVDALNVGVQLTDSFTALSEDGTPQVVTITIFGTNDPAIISGDLTGTVIEDMTLTAQGTLFSSDVDNNDNIFQPISSGTPTTNGFGTFELAANGNWTFTLDNNHPLVDALNVGVQLTDSIIVHSEDGTPHTVNITIQGKNDAAIITGNSTGTVVEDMTLTAQGTLFSSDVDNTDNSFIPVLSGQSSDLGLGTFTITASGNWTYELFNTLPIVDALNNGQQLFDSFTVQSEDGTNHLVNITINGKNDPAMISGQDIEAIDEDGPTFVEGTLLSSDVDNDDNVFQTIAPGTSSAQGFGTIEMNSNGTWRYTIDNNNSAVDALNNGDQLVDNFTVFSQDSTPHMVSIIIHGKNDQAIISGSTMGMVVEDTSTSTSGTLTSQDVDNNDNVFQPVASGTPSLSGHGTFQLTADGNWVYFVNIFDPDINALNSGDQLTDGFIAFTEDGTPQLVSIIIKGANDAAMISGTTSAIIVEDSTPTVQRTVFASDVDNNDNEFTPVPPGTSTDSGFGTFEMAANGVWTYTLNNAHPMVDKLNNGGVLTDSFTISSIDGTPQNISVEIHGANDSAMISGTTSGLVIEDSSSITSGVLYSQDVDNNDNVFQPVSFGAPSDMGFGTFQLLGDGTWIYTLDDSNSTVNNLNITDQLIDHFTVHSEDGTPQLITIDIFGTNDAPIIISSPTASVPENQIATGIDVDIAPDPDGPNLSFSIIGGADGSLFNIDSNTGLLTFIAPPDFEVPLDSNSDNIYEVRVAASDSIDIDTQDVFVQVTDVFEAPQISIGKSNLEHTEGSREDTTFTFNVFRGNGDLSLASSFRYNIMGAGTNPVDSFDFVSPLQDVITFAPFQSFLQVSIIVSGDLDNEPDEGFTIFLDNPSNATIDPLNNFAIGTILNDDAPPQTTSVFSIFSIPDNPTGGGDSVLPEDASEPYFFKIVRSGDDTTTQSVFYEPGLGISQNPADASDFGGTFQSPIQVIFNPGDHEILVTVNPAIQDNILEEDEDFTVTLFSPTNGAIIDSNNSFAQGIIQDVTLRLPPVVLDLDDDGVELLPLSDSKVYQDIDADGKVEHLAWVGPDDGLLVYDANANYQVDGPEEWVLTHWAEEIGYKNLTDIEALQQVFDTNHDNLFDTKDDKFAEFGVWQDKNSDGIQDDGEYQTLSALGITSINLVSDHERIETYSHVIYGETTYTLTDGSVHIAGDVGLAYEELVESSDPSIAPQNFETPDYQIELDAAYSLAEYDFTEAESTHQIEEMLTASTSIASDLLDTITILEVANLTAEDPLASLNVTPDNGEL